MERALRETLVDGSFGDVKPGDVRRAKAVKSTNNKTTERRFRAILVASSVRGWKVRPKGLTGSPDFYFPAARLVVFLDGCYWHACPRCGHVPSVNRPFWSAKLQRNQERDREKERKLEQEGYRFIRFWEHELREEASGCLARLRDALATFGKVEPRAGRAAVPLQETHRASERRSTRSTADVVPTTSEG